MASTQAPDLLTPTAKGLRLSATLEINELVRQRLDVGKQVVHLGFGEATFPMQKDVLQAHREASSDTSYLPVAGLPALREVNHSKPSRLVYVETYGSLVHCTIPNAPSG